MLAIVFKCQFLYLQTRFWTQLYCKGCSSSGNRQYSVHSTDQNKCSFKSINKDCLLVHVTLSKLSFTPQHHCAYYQCCVRGSPRRIKWYSVIRAGFAYMQFLWACIHPWHTGLNPDIMVWITRSWNSCKLLVFMERILNSTMSSQKNNSAAIPATKNMVGWSSRIIANHI